MVNSPINNVQPEQELNNEQMPIDTTSSPTSAKPIVGCSASLSEIEVAKNFLWDLLPTKDWFVSLSKLPKEELNKLYKSQWVAHIAAKKEDGLVVEEHLSIGCSLNSQ